MTQPTPIDLSKFTTPQAAPFDTPHLQKRRKAKWEAKFEEARNVLLELCDPALPYPAIAYILDLFKLLVKVEDFSQDEAKLEDLYIEVRDLLTIRPKLPKRSPPPNRLVKVKTRSTTLPIIIEQQNDTIQALQTTLAAQSHQLQLATQALQDIIDPIAAISRKLLPDQKLEGAMAVYNSNDPNYLKCIAHQAIDNIEAIAPPTPPTNASEECQTK